MKEYIVKAYKKETIDAFDVQNAPEIVRCKDCKYFKDNRCLNDNVHYSIDDCGCNPAFCVADYWFCAEGERR